MKVRVSGIKEIQDFIKRIVPRGMKKAVMFAISEYIVGDDSHGLRHETPYKYVTRKSAYGFTFFTEKQRRWFWANGGPEMIGNNRTHAMSKAWDFTDQGGWDRVSIFNQTPGVQYVMGNNQARQPAKVGWRKAVDVIRSNLAGALRAGQKALNELIARKGK
jgi:hypothetical protein